MHDFLFDGYGEIRFPFQNSTQSNIAIFIHDAFQSPQVWNGFMPYPQWQGVVLDTHKYEVFSDEEVAMTQQEHISAACAAAEGLSASGLWTIVGEWSTASTDGAKYLNGRGVGARYDGTYPGSTAVGSCTGMSGSIDSFSDEYKVFLRQYWEAQVSVVAYIVTNIALIYRIR